jgi:hypothetical protein
MAHITVNEVDLNPATETPAPFISFPIIFSYWFRLRFVVAIASTNRSSAKRIAVDDYTFCGNPSGWWTVKNTDLMSMRQAIKKILNRLSITTCCRRLYEVAKMADCFQITMNHIRYRFAKKATPLNRLLPTFSCSPGLAGLSEISPEHLNLIKYHESMRIV